MIQEELPRRVDKNISVEQVGNETLIYDETSHKAFCLNRTSSAVWRLCDGTHTQSRIAAAATLELAEPVSEELVAFALHQLGRDGLLQATPSPSQAVLSRRELVEKLGVRALILLPVIAAVMVPETAQALSGIVDGAALNRNASRMRSSPSNQRSGTIPKAP